jgi:hypothetical protein
MHHWELDWGGYGAGAMNRSCSHSSAFEMLIRGFLKHVSSCCSELCQLNLEVPTIERSLFVDLTLCGEEAQSFVVSK